MGILYSALKFLDTEISSCASSNVVESFRADEVCMYFIQSQTIEYCHGTSPSDDTKYDVSSSRMCLASDEAFLEADGWSGNKTDSLLALQLPATTLPPDDSMSNVPGGA